MTVYRAHPVVVAILAVVLVVVVAALFVCLLGHLRFLCFYVFVFSPASWSRYVWHSFGLVCCLLLIIASSEVCFVFAHYFFGAPVLYSICLQPSDLAGFVRFCVLVCVFFPVGRWREQGSLLVSGRSPYR